MKPFYLLASVLVPASAFAQTPTAPSTPAATTPAASTSAALAGELPYEELMKQGEEKLVPQGPNKTTYEGAAILLFYRASKVAPDESKKLEALLRMARAQEAMKQFPSAMETYSSALALKSITAAQRARARFGLADAEYSSLKPKGNFGSRADAIRSGYEAALASTELPAPLRFKAHEAIADLFAAQGKYLLAAQTVQKLLALPGFPAEARAVFYGRAFDYLKKAPVDPNALALANTLYAQYLPSVKTPADIARLKNTWAETLAAQKDMSGALKKWEEIASDNALPLDPRAVALRNINIAQRHSKNYSAALAAADRQSTLPGATPHMLAWRAWDRAAVFNDQQQEAKARLEWQALTALPNALPADKGLAWLEIAKSYTRSLKALPADAPDATKAPLQAGLRQALENTWKTEGTPVATRVQALLDRAQLEVDAKNLPGAVAVLLGAVKASDTMQATPAEVTDVRRRLYLALGLVYRAQKQYALAITALTGAQLQSPANDNSAATQAVAISQEAYAAKDWDATRLILGAMERVWGLSHKTYLLNLAQVEVSAQKWDAAKKALDELATLNPTDKEKDEAAKLRAQLPAGQ